MRWVLLIYFVIWGALGLVSYLRIRTQRTAAGKKRLFDRWTVVMGGFVAVAMSVVAILMQHYLLVPVCLGACALITFLNLRFTFFCDRCGRRSQIWAAREAYCPACGERLR